MVFTVSLSEPSSQIITVDYVTVEGTATADTDYTSIERTTLTFEPGQISKIVDVQLYGDVFDEEDEYFELDLSSLSPRVKP